MMFALYKYIKIARFDHWIKQLFVLPGAFFAYFIADSIKLNFNDIVRVFLALLATAFTASANYIINEWLDRNFDKHHPIKKHRPAVSAGLTEKIVYVMYVMFFVVGIALASTVNIPVLVVVVFLFVMGIIYNVKPFRSKDVPYCDVLSESINNALRLLIGWFAVAPTLFPPSSIVLGYWWGGLF